MASRFLHWDDRPALESHVALASAGITAGSTPGGPRRRLSTLPRNHTFRIVAEARFPLHDPPSHGRECATGCSSLS